MSLVLAPFQRPRLFEDAVTRTTRPSSAVDIFDSDHKFEQHGENGGYCRIERNYGSFVHTFSVPSTVGTENVKADYAQGVLTTTLPKKDAAKPREVRVSGVNGSAEAGRQ